MLDTEAVARVASGDRDAFASVVHRYHRRLYYYVIGKTADYGEAEDIVQKTFVTAFRRLAEYDPRQPLLAWLRGIALNHCRNELRAACRQARLRERLLEARRAELALGMLEEPEARDERRVGALRKCVESLGEREQKALELRFVEEAPLPSIGEALSRSAEAARLLLFRVRQRLAACVKKRLALEERA